MKDISFVRQFQSKIDRLNEEGILPAYFKAPVFALWELTDKCNLSCIHCYYNSNREDPKNELSAKEALNVIAQLARMKVFEVYLTGGEALLREDWPLLIETLRKNNIQVGIITNGTKIDARTAKALADFKVKWVQISIDGAGPDTHDAVRGLKGGWEKSINAIRLLRKNCVRAHVSFVPTRINYRDVKKVVALCVEMGLEYFVTDMLVLTGRAVSNFDDIKLTASEYSEFYDLVEQAAETYSGKITIIAPSRREKETLKTYVQTRSATPNIWCIITPQGSCRLDLLLPFTYGDLRTQSLQHIWDNFLRRGWERPEVNNFIRSLNKMQDLSKSKVVPYVSENIHCQ